MINIFWFRRDLRLDDNAGLYHALKSGRPVLPVFIFDRNILDDIEDKDDRRVAFIHSAINELQSQLVQLGASLEVYHGFPAEIFEQLLKKYRVAAIFTNEDYEQYAIDRDEQVRNLAKRDGCTFTSYKDHVIFSKEEIMKDDGKPYTVFTPYSRKWRARLDTFHTASYPCHKYHDRFFKQEPASIPPLVELGFNNAEEAFPSKEIDETIIKQYDGHRDYPGSNGTSRLSVHLRFGTISIRALARKAMELNSTYLNELTWRDFYQAILWNMPRVRNGESCKPEYDRIEWRNNEQEFYAWCSGRTGYPLVDAGMRELNSTGFMHNRVRMVTASFLCKHLLIDWRWGESYFAKKLLDYDFAANNGGWQWCAGSGCDAAPYFRIFNPAVQAAKFDKGMDYIKRWVPEITTKEYPQPIVDHQFARRRCLEVYQWALRS